MPPRALSWRQTSQPAAQTRPPLLIYPFPPDEVLTARDGGPLSLLGDYSGTERFHAGNTHRTDMTLVHRLPSPDRRTGLLLSDLPPLINYTFVCTCIRNARGQSGFFCSAPPSPHRGDKGRNGSKLGGWGRGAEVRHPLCLKCYNHYRLG